MTGEYQSLHRDTFQVDETYFKDLAQTVRDHEESALEQRIHDAGLSPEQQQHLRKVSADFVIARTLLPREEIKRQQHSLLAEAAQGLPLYPSVAAKQLGRDVQDGKTTLLVGGQPLEIDEVATAYTVIPPSRELLDIRQAETAITPVNFYDRTHPDPGDPMFELANPEGFPVVIAEGPEVPIWVDDEPEDDVVEPRPEDQIEPTYPYQLHTGLGAKVVELVTDTGKILIEKLAS